MVGLTDKEIIELRLSCLKPFVESAAKQNLERLTFLPQAEKAWEFATKTLDQDR